MRLLSIGHGYSARALAPLLLARGWEVAGTTRSQEKARDIEATGVRPILWPGSDLGPEIARATHVLHSVSPDDGDPVLVAHGGDLGRARLDWFGYLSTTGVYGDHDGGWVDEETPLAPSTARGAARVRAEAGWRALAREAGLPLHVFRLAGIYGPGRGPFAKVREGRARRIVKAGQVFSRIHVEDIAAVCLASIDRPRPGAIYNVCDDDPAPPQDVIAHAADLLGVERPPQVTFEEADLSPMARSFYAESKRVQNHRIKSELGVELRYPTYRHGLAALLDEDT